MDYCTPQANRRHNPVDSICRKLQTIQWRGERAPNSPFQIPKFSSSSYDSPQCGLRHNVEAILKKGGCCRGQGEGGREVLEEAGRVGKQSQKTHPSSSIPPCTNPPTPANVTYTIMSTLGERRGADGSEVKQAKMWQRYCSTPTTQSKDSPGFAFPRGQRQGETPNRSPPLSRTFTPHHGTFSLNFCSAEQGNATERELPYPALVVKRLSLGDGGEGGQPDPKGALPASHRDTAEPHVGMHPYQLNDALESNSMAFGYLKHCFALWGNIPTISCRGRAYFSHSDQIKELGNAL